MTGRGRCDTEAAGGLGLTCSTEVPGFTSTGSPSTVTVSVLRAGRDPRKARRPENREPGRHVEVPAEARALALRSPEDNIVE